MNVVIGLPAYNEEKNIARIIARLQDSQYTIIVCNDGSTDLTGSISEKMGVTVLNHPRNLGYGAAIKSLFKKAKELSCDVLVTFDADGQHSVSEISNLINPIKKGEADIVIGSRFLEGKGKNIPRYRKVGIKVITSLTTSLTELKLTDSQSGFRGYSNRVLQEIIPSESGMGVSTEILIKASKKNFRIKEIPITVFYGEETSTHNPVPHGISVILSTMKFISIERPLRFYGIPGIIFLAIGLFFVVLTLQIFADTRQVTTNVALVGVSSTIFGTILLMTSILLYSIVSVVRERHSDK